MVVMLIVHINTYREVPPPPVFLEIHLNAGFMFSEISQEFFHQPPTTDRVTPSAVKLDHSSKRKHKNVFVHPAWLQCWLKVYTDF